MIDVSARVRRSASYFTDLSAVLKETPGPRRAGDDVHQAGRQRRRTAQVAGAHGVRSLLDFSADLSVAPRYLPVTLVAGPWVLDWRDITRDGQGRPGSVREVSTVSRSAFLTSGMFGRGPPGEDLRHQRLSPPRCGDSPLHRGAHRRYLALATDRATGAAFPGLRSWSGRGPGMLALACSRRLTRWCWWCSTHLLASGGGGVMTEGAPRSARRGPRRALAAGARGLAAGAGRFAAARATTRGVSVARRRPRLAIRLLPSWSSSHWTTDVPTTGYVRIRSDAGARHADVGSRPSRRWITARPCSA